MVSGQAAFPPGYGFNQAVTKRQIPANQLNGLSSFHALSMCVKNLPVHVNTIDM
jgi:hypothetical protein